MDARSFRPTRDLRPSAVPSNDAAPVPAALPRIVWRAGLDLNPLDMSRSVAGRMARDAGLARADRAARQSASRAPDRGRRSSRASSRATSPVTVSRSSHAKRRSDATLVVFHTAVLAYVPDLGRPAGLRRPRDAARHLDLERDAGRLSRHCASVPMRAAQPAAFCCRSTARRSPGPTRTALRSIGSQPDAQAGAALAAGSRRGRQDTSAKITAAAADST